MLIGVYRGRKKWVGKAGKVNGLGGGGRVSRGDVS